MCRITNVVARGAQARQDAASRVGLLVLALFCFVVEPSRSDEPTAWPIGRWRVVECGFGLDCRLARLEIRPGKNPNEMVLTAFEASEPGHDRLWASTKLEHPDARGTVKPLRAEWTSAGATNVLLLRAEPTGRMSALLRQRDRNRPWASGEQIRQLLLAPEQGLDQVVTQAPAPKSAARPGSDLGPSGAPRTDLALLYAVHPDGTGLRVVALPDGFTRAGYPAWSPDGQKIAFTAFDASGRDPLIRIVDAKGGTAVAVAAGIAPSWSHDGTRLAYVATGKPDYATDWNLLGRNEERIEAIHLAGPRVGELEVLARGIWPRWSPIDDRLAFVARLDANWDLYLRSTDGARLSRLTDDPSNDTNPVWTRDGRAIVFLSDRLNRWDLYKVAADGQGQVTQVTNHRRREEQADLSPDGSRVVFTDGLGRLDSRVMLLDLASGSVHPLTEGARGDRDPAWSPDGHTIAFISRRPSPLLPVNGSRP
jgi:Tol biopolymer transport system component